MVGSRTGSGQLIGSGSDQKGSNPTESGSATLSLSSPHPEKKPAMPIWEFTKELSRYIQKVYKFTAFCQEKNNLRKRAKKGETTTYLFIKRRIRKSLLVTWCGDSSASGCLAGVVQRGDTRVEEVNQYNGWHLGNR